MTLNRLISLMAVAGLLAACSLPGQTAEPVETPATNTSAAVTPTSPSQNAVATPAPTATAAPAASAVPAATAAPSDTPLVIASSTPTSPTLTPIKDPVNCRYGPGTLFAALGTGLPFGRSAPITARSGDTSYLQIPNPDGSDGVCWVAASVVTTSGDLSSLPVLSPPAAQVTDVTVAVNPPSITAGSGCGMPVGYSYSGTITVNGPTTVRWHWELNAGDVILGTKSTTFTAYGSHTVTDTYHVGMTGSSNVKMVVTSPNSVIGTASFTVTCP